MRADEYEIMNASVIGRWWCSCLCLCLCHVLGASRRIRNYEYKRHRSVVVGLRLRWPKLACQRPLSVERTLSSKNLLVFSFLTSSFLQKPPCWSKFQLVWQDTVVFLPNIAMAEEEVDIDLADPEVSFSSKFFLKLLCTLGCTEI